VKTLASGWCPKHDRVFEKANRCPECGTTLVPLEAASKPSKPEDHRSVVDPDVAEPAPTPVRNPWVARVALAAAIVTAFVLGLVFPRDGADAPLPDSQTALRRRTATTSIAQTPHGTLSMVGLTQTDERLTAVFRTVSGFADPRLIGDAAVELSIAGTGGAEGRSFSLSETRLIANAEGFTITGRLDAPGDIVELRISSLQVQDPRTPEWRVDLSAIWPVKGSQPTVLHAEDRQSSASGTIVLTALLGWSDRVEAVFDLRDPQGAAGMRSEIVGFDMLVTPVGATGNVQGRSITAIQTEQVSVGQIVARFESVPANAGSVVIRATGLLNFVEGPWRWRLS
jgi:hypothetical protein